MPIAFPSRPRRPLAAAAGAILAFALAAPHAVPEAFARPLVAVEMETGALIHHEEAFRPWAPASLTKLMTALVAFREIEAGRATPETRVVLSAKAAAEPASKMYWEPGTSLSLRDALELIMVKSANDVSLAIAETLGGSESGFADMMNAEARRIGMTGSNFRNPHGLPDSEQITTAHDMAVLARTIRRDFPQYDPIFRLEAIDTGEGKPLLSYNLVLGRYEGADGMKTGFVCASGFNIVTSATREVDGEDRTVIAVVLGAPNQEWRAETAVDLMERGFAEPLPDETLDGLEPYGDTVTRTDLRPEICTAEAQAARYDGRDVEGRMVLDTDLITARVRPPITARVSFTPPIPEPRDKPIALRAPGDPRGTEPEAELATIEGTAIDGLIETEGGVPVPAMRPLPDAPVVDATTTGSVATQ